MESYHKNLMIESLKELLSVSPSPGFLLITGDGVEENIITIGWFQVGIIWNEPCISVFIRKSRHTYKVLQKSDSFTLNVVSPSEYNKIIDFCSQNSGSNCDKFVSLGLEKEKSKTIKSNSLKISKLVIECSIMSRIDMDKNNLSGEINSKFYSNNDYHQIIIGKVLYVKEKE